MVYFDLLRGKPELAQQFLSFQNTLNVMNHVQKKVSNLFLIKARVMKNIFSQNVIYCFLFLREAIRKIINFLVIF